MSWPFNHSEGFLAGVFFKQCSWVSCAAAWHFGISGCSNLGHNEIASVLAACFALTVFVARTCLRWYVKLHSFECE